MLGLRQARKPWRSFLVRSPRARLFNTSHRLSGQAPKAENMQSGVDRVISRLPRFLRRHAEPLRSAPITHVSAFLVLHELTAILPLFTLAATFHYTQWLPPFVSEWKWVSQGVEKFGRYFQRKGWLGQEERSRYKWWQRGEGGVRIVVEFATAYALTKALLPLRLIVSVWATPWFARVSVVPFVKLLKRTFGNKSKVAPKSGAAGTGATEGGVLAKGRMDSKRTTAPPVKGKGAGSV